MAEIKPGPPPARRDRPLSKTAATQPPAYESIIGFCPSMRLPSSHILKKSETAPSLNPFDSAQWQSRSSFRVAASHGQNPTEHVKWSPCVPAGGRRLAHEGSAGGARGTRALVRVPPSCQFRLGGPRLVVITSTGRGFLQPAFLAWNPQLLIGLRGGGVPNAPSATNIRLDTNPLPCSIPLLRPPRESERGSHVQA